MADYQNPDPNHDPAGNTQMFRAFVDEGSAPQQHNEAAPTATTYGSSRNPRTGLIVGIVAAVLVVAVVVYIAMA